VVTAQNVPTFFTGLKVGTSLTVLVVYMWGKEPVL
ncbi:hypothetical protein LSH36_167g04036, partial [Paralvinella palmiformis]